MSSVIAAFLGLVAITSGLLVGASRRLGGIFATEADGIPATERQSVSTMADFGLRTSVLSDPSFLLSLTLVTVGGMVVVAMLTLVVLSRRRRSQRV